MRQLYSIDQRNRTYVIRFQVSLVISLILFLLVFRYWPAFPTGETDMDDRFAEEQVIGSDFIVTHPHVTVERTVPQVPRPESTVPDDDVVDVEYDLELGENLHRGELASFFDGEGDPEIIDNPDRRPRVRRIVEPVMPSDARRDGVRVEIFVLFIVSKEGEVVDVSIDEMRKYNEQTGRFDEVGETGYGFREITLRAARQWLFHPAELDGELVRSRVRHHFTFGN